MYIYISKRLKILLYYTVETVSLEVVFRFEQVYRQGRTLAEVNVNVNQQVGKLFARSAYIRYRNMHSDVNTN